MNDDVFRILVLGGKNTGKTTYVSKINAECKNCIWRDNLKVFISQATYKPDACLIFLSYDRQESVEEASELMKKHPSIPNIVCANKLDLHHNGPCYNIPWFGFPNHGISCTESINLDTPLKEAIYSTLKYKRSIIGILSCTTFICDNVITDQKLRVQFANQIRRDSKLFISFKITIQSKKHVIVIYKDDMLSVSESNFPLLLISEHYEK